MATAATAERERLAWNKQGKETATTAANWRATALLILILQCRILILQNPTV